VADPSVGPEQHVIDADIAQTLRKLAAELSPRRRTLVRMLFTRPSPVIRQDRPDRRYPGRGNRPTRARALRQLRDRLCERELGSEIA
jgi:hypothetical protein